MKSWFLGLFLFILPSVSFAQKRSYWYDSLVLPYNYLQNKPFAALELEDTSGNLVKTTDLVGKTVYVDFWFTTCPPCLKEIPHTKKLKEFFSADTNIVFLSICIENIDRKAAWKNMIREKGMPGIHLFYARNRPQKVNLLREYKITFPTYLLLDTDMKIIGFNAPRPSEKGFVYWAIEQAKNGVPLMDAYKQMATRSKQYDNYLNEHSFMND